MSKVAQSYSKLFKVVQSCPKLSKVVESCSALRGVALTLVPIENSVGGTSCASAPVTEEVSVGGASSHGGMPGCCGCGSCGGDSGGGEDGGDDMAVWAEEHRRTVRTSAHACAPSREPLSVFPLPLLRQGLGTLALQVSRLLSRRALTAVSLCVRAHCSATAREGGVERDGGRERERKRKRE